MTVAFNEQHVTNTFTTPSQLHHLPSDPAMSLLPRRRKTVQSFFCLHHGYSSSLLYLDTSDVTCFNSLTSSPHLFPPPYYRRFPQSKHKDSCSICSVETRVICSNVLHDNLPSTNFGLFSTQMTSTTSTCPILHSAHD